MEYLDVTLIYNFAHTTTIHSLQKFMRSLQCNNAVLPRMTSDHDLWPRWIVLAEWPCLRMKLGLPIHIDYSFVAEITLAYVLVRCPIGLSRNVFSCYAEFQYMNEWELNGEEVDIAGWRRMAYAYPYPEYQERIDDDSYCGTRRTHVGTEAGQSGSKCIALHTSYTRARRAPPDTSHLILAPFHSTHWHFSAMHCFIRRRGVSYEIETMSARMTHVSRLANRSARNFCMFICPLG